MNMQNTETKPAASADPVILASHRLVLAMAQSHAAHSLTGPFTTDHRADEEAALEIISRMGSERAAAAACFAEMKPETPMAFLVYLRAFVKALEPDNVCTFDSGEDPEIEEPSLLTVARNLSQSFERIFMRHGGNVHAVRPTAHRSRAIEEIQVRNRMMDLCDVLPLRPRQIEGALQSDDALIAFAIRHNESLDWIVMGAEHARRHRPAQAAAE